MPGGIAPEHKHDGFDEALYILEVELEMQMDGKTMTVAPDYFINIRRGTVYGYQNKTSTPAGIDHFYQDIDSNVKIIPDDLGKVAAMANKHQIQIMPQVSC